MARKPFPADQLPHGAPRRTPPEPRPADAALNDRIQDLMRDSADRLDERTRNQAATDATSDKAQLDAVIALAKGRNRARR